MPAPLAAPPTRERWPWAGRALFGAWLGVVLALLGQTWWAIAQDRRQTMAAELHSGLTTTRLLEEHATLIFNQAVRDLDSLTQGVRDHQTQTGSTDQDAIRNVLSRAQPYNHVLKALQYVNPEGVASVSSIDYPAYQVDADDRTYIPQLLAQPGQRGLVIGRPFQRFYDTQWVVPLARNLYDRTGRHLGLISSDVSVSYFNTVYDRMAKEQQALVSLFTHEGTVIVRSPADPTYVGLDISEMAAFQRFRAQVQDQIEGSFEDARLLDQASPVRRLYIFRQVAGFPVYTVFARSLDDILTPWQQRSRDRTLLSGAMVLFLSALSFTLHRYIRRLQTSEASLRRSELSLRQSELKFFNLFQYSPSAVALIRLRSHQIAAVNDSWTILMGFAPDEALGHTPLTLGVWSRPVDREAYLSRLERDHQVQNMEVNFRRKDGQTLICLLSARLVTVDGELTALCTLVDISHQRRIEDDFRRLNTELEARVQARTASLQAAKSQLERALAERQAMQDELIRADKMAALGSLVAGVSHELNTPIGNGVTLASTLEDNTRRLLAELQGGSPRRSVMTQLLEADLKGAELLVRTLARAAELIQSFKQVAVDQSSDHRRSFELGDTLRDILSTLEPIYHRQAVNVQLALSPGLRMDSYPGALAQILTNLVNNAVLHGFEGRSGGLITVSIQPQDDAQVLLSFADNGVGIAPEHQARIFDPFFTTKLGRGGSGLGMHIVYNLVTHLLGGRIELDSTPGQGTCYRLWLPRVAPQRTSSEPAPHFARPVTQVNAPAPGLAEDGTFDQWQSP